MMLCPGLLYPPLRDAFIHKSIIGSLFYDGAEAAAGGFSAISPSITDQAWITGYNAIFSMAGILLLRASPFSRLIAADSAASMRAK